VGFFCFTHFFSSYILFELVPPIVVKFVEKTVGSVILIF